MTILGLVLFIIHILAFIAGGANSVIMPVMGPRLAAATPETRPVLMGIITTLARVGKYAMATLLVTGVLVLWLKWNFTIPSPWFWAKMAFIVLMIVFIQLNERSFKQAMAGDRAAAKRSQMFGQLTGLSFLGVIASAVFAFN